MSAQPHLFPRRILLLVSGMSPQIVTETLFALSQVQKPAFLPTEVHLVSTKAGAEQARLNLLSGSQHFARLCKEYTLDASIFNAERIGIIEDKNGLELTDIRTPAENEATADYITHKVRELTADPRAALHVSMAGGRKTMGYYAGYALSLFGRPQDRLSHVLVSEGYEGLADFYYPTRRSHTIHDRNGKAMDAAKAQISLAEIPFVRLRSGLPRSLLNGAHGFGQTVELARRATEPARLWINPAEGEYRMNDTPGKLSPVQMGILLWAATRETPIVPLVDGEKNQYADEFISVARQHNISLSDKTTDSLRPSRDSDMGMTQQFLEQTISKLNKAFSEQLGPELAALCKLAKVIRGGKAGYALPENLDVTITQQDWT